MCKFSLERDRICPESRCTIKERDSQLIYNTRRETRNRNKAKENEAIDVSRT